MNQTMETNSNGISGMTGSYNSNSLPQLGAVQSSIPFIHQAIDALDIVSPSFPVIIADFGSSHGVNSMYAIKSIIDYIKQSKKSENPFLVIHNDLPTNDWTSLFNVLNQDKTYFGLSSGRSFYEQCLPSNLLTIGYSSTSIQWLSQKPCNISNHCICLFAPVEELAAFQIQAQHDYAQFLENRSREMIQGGVFILTILSTDEEGKTPLDYSFNQLYKCAKLLPLSEEELLDYTIPLYPRSYKECLDEEIFKRCSLKLIKSDFCHTKAKFYEDFQQGRITVEQFAQIHTDFQRSWGEAILKQTLKMNKNRSEEDIDQLLNQFWLIYKQQMKENPEE
jgi:hypothetical protein